MLLLQIPSFQGFVAKQVSHALEQKLGTKVDIGRINLGFLNRIIIDNVLVYDQTKKQMLQASRLAAKIDVLPLLSEGRIYVSSAQLFGVKANLYRKSALEKDNFQFILDSLSSKEDSKTPLDLRIQSLIIRNGAISYHQLDAQQTKSVFNPKHLNVSGISAHIMLPRMTEDTLSLSVKKLSFLESSGLDVKNMFFNLNVGKRNATLDHFLLRLPNTQIRIDELSAHYHLNKKQQLDRSSLSYNLVLNESNVTPSDFACFLPELKRFENNLSMIADARGNHSTFYLDKVRINESTGSFGVKGSGMISEWSSSPHWKFLLDDLKITPKGHFKES